MPNKTWLLLDVPYLCHRAFHTTGSLMHEGRPTGTLFGFFREIASLMDRFQTKRLAFFFDLGDSKRKAIYPGYKAKRKKTFWTKDQAIAHKAMHEQMDRLRTEYLFQLGFKNIFAEDGFEADDLIASGCSNPFHNMNRVVIVGSDKDLYQLLQYCYVDIYNPQTRAIYDYDCFTNEYGITPDRWPHVKALAGCSTDSIEGIKGVGEKTAANYFAGKLKSSTKTYKAIVAQNDEMYDRNLPLVQLPFEGTPKIELQDDKFSLREWSKLMKSLDMESLVNAPTSVW